MASGVELNESSETMAGAGVSLCFPVNSPSKLPLRLQRRLSECRSPSTVEEIEAKLREAGLRRQQFYEFLANKARPRRRPRSPSSSSSQEEDLVQRLEAKLNAAEQKRLSILAKAQMRLARVDEMRQAAKDGVEMRFKKQRGELVMKVESRVQQAEVNRMMIQKSCRQRRAARKERTAQSLMRRTIQESKYKEHVRAAIHQKRIAAERKRLGLLEAERLKARARLLRVQKAAKSVYTKREMERIKKKEELEDRLQKARILRAELLRQRKSANCSRANTRTMHEQAENLARKLLRCWRRFINLRGSTYSLVKTFEGLNISEKSVKSMAFEKLALLIGSDGTLKTVKSLLDRIEVHVRVRSSPGVENIDHLLKRVASPPKRRRNVSHENRSRTQKRVVSGKQSPQSLLKMSRYPVRVALCAYMILGHPDAVLSGTGGEEMALTEASVTFIQEFESLLSLIIEDRQMKSPSGDGHVTFRSQLAAFDKAWCSYLYRFVSWKVKDAKLLEEDLVRAACHLELSMMQTCKVSPNGGGNSDLTHDMRAIQKQVVEDQTLLKEKVHNLSGHGGIERMENALSDVRTKYFASKECGSPLLSPVVNIASPVGFLSLDSSPSSVSGEPSGEADVSERRSSVVRSLFKEDAKTTAQVLSIAENEVLVNEIVHEHRHGFADSLDVSQEDDNSIKTKITETMEKAFWDGVTESMKQEHPDYSWILKLLTEVRDELCEMSPSSWKQEITNTIDLDILSQVLSCGTLDINYLGKILEYALMKVQKLSAPVNDDRLQAAHQNLLKELNEVSVSQTGDNSNSSLAMAVIKGLRYVLQQIQTLKREISKARIKMIEPMIKGPAGLEYLMKAFSNRYGPPDACTSLPVTKSWLSQVRTNAELEWGEYVDSLSTLGTPPKEILPTTLRTGGSVSVTSRIRSLGPTVTGKEQPECQGERVDLLVRLGLLKLVSEIEGLVQETLPETLKLNISRLRAVQSLIQKIVVVSTSMLVLRQTLVSDHLVTSLSDIEAIITRSSEKLFELLDKVDDVSISEIVDSIISPPADVCHIVNVKKLLERKEVVENMVSKSLKSGDTIFTRVSRAIYLATRGAVLGGTGRRGRQMAEMELRRVGATFLTEKVLEAAEVLVVVATVSGSVHGAWYAQILKNM